jgi:tetratricopeptide (TPR) repeat protein
MIQLGAGCSATTLPAAFHRGQAHERRGDHAAALAAYRRALPRCPDAEGCLSTRLRIAEQLVALRRFRDAARSYLALSRTTQLARGRARAQHRAARLYERQLGEPARARALYRRTLLGYPDEPAGEDALRDGFALARRQLGVASALTELLALYPRVRHRRLADNLLFTAAQVYARHGRPTEAIQLYQRLLVEMPKSPLVDDALWEAARLDEAAGRWRAALKRYRRLLVGRTYPLLGAGSFNSVYVDDAQLRRGLIYYQQLKQPKRALRELRLLRDDFPDSRLRDDAAWWIARIHHEAKRKHHACVALATLLTRFPDGNHARRAARARKAWGCK